MTHFAEACEAAGLEGIWGIQLYGPPFIPLAAAAMVSKRLKLGTGVALAFTRSPLETALSAIDIDTISGGRMVLGLGTQALSWVESGMDFADALHLASVSGETEFATFDASLRRTAGRLGIGRVVTI